MIGSSDGLGVQHDGPPGLGDLFAGPLAHVAQRLNAVEDEEREADIAKPGRVGRRAVHERKCDDGVGVALARDDERERALVALDQALGAGGQLDDARLGDVDQRQVANILHHRVGDVPVEDDRLLRRPSACA